MRRVLVVARTMLRLLAAMVLLAACATSATPTVTRSPEAGPTEAPAPQASDGGDVIIERITRAWTSGSRTDIEAAYAPNAVVTTLDKEAWGERSRVADNREEIIELIQGSLESGNTWRHVGPPAAYPASFGRLYVTTMLEVTGLAHPGGDPIVFIIVAREGQVVSQLMVEPKVDL